MPNEKVLKINPLQKNGNQNNKREEKPRVLVADDEPNILRAMSLVLKSKFDVTTVKSGDKAIEKIQQGMDFDVISLDLQMPGLSGIESLKAIKQLSPSTEVLIVTAHSDLESAKGALKFGAYDYINKPFDNAELIAAFYKGVKRRRNAMGAGKTKEQLAFVKAQLMQSEKFSAIGQLLSGVAHELNNPLAAVIGFSELLLARECSPDIIRNYLERINKNSLLCKNIVKKLLSFSRKEESKLEYIRINQVIESTLDLKQYDFRVDSVQVVRQLADNMPNTMADFYELQQVFLNMINNAHQAMKMDAETRTLTIKSEFDKKTIRISFLDTGPGIPKKNLHKIFEPLFTTKKRDEGTGLGLSVCHEIIKKHNGDIFVASDKQKGACFVIELPLVGQLSQTAPIPHKKQNP
ncbi:MAG TPA: response regulator [Anaerolineae bacterium]|nr:response regulator [Anaerolineae bacterium]